MADAGMETKKTVAGKTGVRRRVIIATGILLPLMAGLWFTWAGGLTSQHSLVPPMTGEMAVFDPFPAGRTAPEVLFTTAQGAEVTLADFSGDVLVVNFWATWCAPCVAEMPSLNRLQEALGDQGVQVMPISIDRGGMNAVVPFYNRLGLTALPIYLDPFGRVPGAFEAIGLPTTVIIGRDGRWLGTLAGDAHWDSPEALALVGYYAENS